jgi:hypothetical protein
MVVLEKFGKSIVGKCTTEKHEKEDAENESM